MSRRNRPFAKAIRSAHHPGKAIVNQNPAADPTVTVTPTVTDVPRVTAMAMKMWLEMEIAPAPNPVVPGANPVTAKGKSVSPFFVTE